MKTTIDNQFILETLESIYRDTIELHWVEPSMWNNWVPGHYEIIETETSKRLKLLIDCIKKQIEENKLNK